MKIKYVNNEIIIEFVFENEKRIIKGLAPDVWAQVSSLTGLKF